MSDEQDNYLEGDFDELPGEIEPGNEDDPFAELPRLGLLLKHYRSRAGLSQRELSMESRVDQSNISLIEKGSTTNPWNTTLEALAAVLARHIPSTTAKQITARLLEAKAIKTTEYYGVDPQAVMLSDRLATFPPRTKRVIWKLIGQIVGTFEELAKKGE